MKNQLKILLPSRTFDLPSGGEVTLNPFKFQDFPQVIAIIEKYYGLYVDVFNDDDDIFADLDVVDAESAATNNTNLALTRKRLNAKYAKLNAKIAEILLAKAEDKFVLLEEISTLIRLASGKSCDDINQLTYDEVVSLFAEIVDMNGDFFARTMNAVKGKKQEEQEESLKTGELESSA